ncbi:MAG: HEAT repeat domain-containing protein [Acidobacteria bacterium]|nr:HEAT repeat domain-containing protein [Acidobacteriota bacterium]
MKMILGFLCAVIAVAQIPEPPTPPEPPAPLAVAPAPAPMKSVDWQSLAELSQLKDVAGLASEIQTKVASAVSVAKSVSWRADGLAMQIKDRLRTDDAGERQYERGMRSLDKRQWDEALAQFTEVGGSGKGRADGALYWKAYALMKLGRGSEALATLDMLAKNHPQSRWLNDAKAMRVEIGQAAGKPVSPEDSSDDEIKVMAINSLMHSDPERSIPLLEQLLTKQSSPRLRERALFVLSQSESPKAREVVARVAKGGANPDLQLIAVRSLGVYGGKENRQLLADIYGSSSDLSVKKQVLNGYMTAGERDRLLAVAKSDPTVDLRLTAIRHLGHMGANSQLAGLYESESSVPVRSALLEAMGNGGYVQKLIEVAKTEKEPALRDRAIRYLGTTRSAETGDALTAIYTALTEVEIRKKILESLAIQGNAKALVELARKETNSDLRRAAVQQLSHMRSKEASDFLMELLNK